MALGASVAVDKELWQESKTARKKRLTLLHLSTLRSFWLDRRFPMRPTLYLSLLAAVAAPALLVGCATQTSQALTVSQTQTATRSYQGPRSPIAVGKFDNRSSYLRGAFSSGVDRLGGQAKTLLISHLQQTQRFVVLDRDNLAEGQREARIQGTTQRLQGADYVVTGDISEFGRRETGDKQLFGLLGRGKTQTAYAKVTLSIVNIRTSEVVHSVQGAGEYQLSSREIVGFGGSAGYDATLNGKVLDLAIREAVDRLGEAVDAGVIPVAAQG